MKSDNYSHRVYLNIYISSDINALNRDILEMMLDDP